MISESCLRYYTVIRFEPQSLVGARFLRPGLAQPDIVCAQQADTGQLIRLSPLGSKQRPNSAAAPKADRLLNPPIRQFAKFAAGPGSFRQSGLRQPSESCARLLPRLPSLASLANTIAPRLARLVFSSFILAIPRQHPPRLRSTAPTRPPLVVLAFSSATRPLLLI